MNSSTTISWDTSLLGSGLAVQAYNPPLARTIFRLAFIALKGNSYPGDLSFDVNTAPIWFTTLGGAQQADNRAFLPGRPRSLQ